MGFMRYSLAIVAAGITHWAFFVQKSHKKWYTFLLAVLFIVFTVFTLDFTLTSALEGAPQAAMVSLLIFGLADVVLFVLWRVAPTIASKLSLKSKTKV